MLDQNDLIQMREMMHEVMGETLEQIVLPKFDEIHREFDQVHQEIAGIKAVMVTRDFLEDRLADFRVSLTDSSDWVGRQLKRLTHTMHQNGLLTSDQLIEIHAK